MGRYRKKPVEIEAIQFTGHNDNEVLAFAGENAFDPHVNRPAIVIRTLEGDMMAEVGDWIICGVNGEHYPCKPDIFIKSYDEV